MVMPYPLKDANAKSIPVISYDRLITGTDAVTYYVSLIISKYVNSRTVLNRQAKTYSR